MNTVTLLVYAFLQVLLLALVLMVGYFLFNGLFTVPWVRTKASITKNMLDIAQVKEGETVVDLGSGDGSVVLEVVKRGARGVGIERLRLLVWLSRFRARWAQCAHHTKFVRKNIFRGDLPEAHVIFLYLYPEFNERLEPILTERYPSGTRVVSRDFQFPNLQAHETKKVGSAVLYLYRIP